MPSTSINELIPILQTAIGPVILISGVGLLILSMTNRLRLAIGLASLSVLLAAILIITLFFTALLRLEVTGVISGLFIGCLVSLISALVAFIYDVHLSLTALKVEMEKDTGNRF